jgi:biopolymer transport protein ExbD
MSITLTTEIGNERRVYTADDLPLSVGGKACHLALHGLPDNGPLAFLGHDRGELFIQPSDERSSAVTLTCNGVHLTASRWLGDRDEIGVDRHRLRCEIRGNTARLTLVRSDVEDPRVADVGVPRSPNTSMADRTIEPADFQPRWQTPPRRSRLRVRPRSLLVAAIVALLAAGAWYVLTARAVRVETTPTADTLRVEGSWLTPKFGESYLLRPGTYTVEAELEGYRSLSAALEVNGDTPSVVGFVLEPLGGLLTVRSSPVDGAEIAIDGAVVGTTPALDLELSAGEHSVELTAPLHLPYRTAIVFEPGDPPRELKAELVPNWAPLTVATTPAGATISVDGAVIGSAPLEDRIEAGDRLIEIRRQGFKPFSRRIQVTAGEAVDLGLVRLVPVDGRLAVSSNPSGATVTVDGLFRGTAPIELDLAPDTSQIQLRLPEADSPAIVEETPEQIDIMITEAGTYFVNGRELINTRPETIRNALQKISGGNNQLPLTISADANAKHQFVVTAMDVAGRLGFTQINIATVNDAASE